MDTSQFERMYEPKVSNSLPAQPGQYLRCIYILTKIITRDYHRTELPIYSKPKEIEGIIFLVPQQQRETTSSTKEYFFQAIKPEEVNYKFPIQPHQVSTIDSEFKLIDNDTNLYPLQDGDGKYR